MPRTSIVPKCSLFAVTRALIGMAVLALTAGCGPQGPRTDPGPTARAEISGCEVDGVSGTAVLRERPSEEGIKLVDVSLEMRGLSDGKHAVHIHEAGVCDPCAAAGGHHDPGPFGRTDPDAPDFNHPFHGGDLISIEVRDGVGVLETTSSRFSLSGGRLSLFDQDGSALVIHSEPDRYCDQEDELEAGCAGGSRDACGVIRLAQ